MSCCLPAVEDNSCIVILFLAYSSFKSSSMRCDPVAMVHRLYQNDKWHVLQGSSKNKTKQKKKKKKKKKKKLTVVLMICQFKYINDPKVEMHVLAVMLDAILIFFFFFFFCFCFFLFLTRAETETAVV